MNLSNPIILSIISALAYGISVPIAKIAFQKGASDNGWVIVYGLSMILLALFSSNVSFKSLFPENISVALLIILAGFICAIGLKTNIMALAVPTSSVSIVVGICASYPAVSALIEMAFMKNNLSTIKVILGLFMIISGDIILSLAKK